MSRRKWPYTDEEIIAYVHEHDADFPEVEYDHTDEPHGGHVYENSKPKPPPEPEPPTEIHIYKDTGISWLDHVAVGEEVERQLPAAHEHEWKTMISGAFYHELVTYCPGCMTVQERVIRES